jgi:hypothetical protein
MRVIHHTIHFFAFRTNSFFKRYAMPLNPGLIVIFLQNPSLITRHLSLLFLQSFADLFRLDRDAWEG